jgi:hypothetical protein
LVSGDYFGVWHSGAGAVGNGTIQFCGGLRAKTKIPARKKEKHCDKPSDQCGETKATFVGSFHHASLWNALP